MNIIENKKRVAIIGEGTAGCISASIFNFYFPDTEIIWYNSPKLLAQSVGEGSALGLPFTLRTALDMGYEDFKKVKGTFKNGIRKINWGQYNQDFMHDFPLGQNGLHFSADELQAHIKEKLNKNVSIKKQHIENYDKLDCDYILDCSGKPSNYDDYHIAPSIPVNSAYIVQCKWDKPQFDYTLTIARPYGWIFGIPLENRCSIGYLYNQEINKIEDIKNDLNEVLIEYGFKPSTEPRTYSFNSYYKKTNFTERVAYNGNSSFFLEPLEATSIGIIQKNAYKALDIFYKGYNLKEANKDYQNHIKEVYFMIMVHYLAGSKFSTPFWENAYKKAQNFISSQSPKNFNEVYNLSKEYLKNNRVRLIEEQKHHNNLSFGTWSIESWNMNLINLDLYNKLDKLI